MSTEAKRIALDVGDWMWGTVQGSFNEKMDVSQIVTDAVFGMIPLVGDVTAARDLIAITLGLAGDPKKREDKMQWLLLVIFIFALIPVMGGVIKGVGRLAIELTETAAKNVKLIEDAVAFMNRIGHGNAVKWLKELDVLKYQAQIMERFNGLVDTMVRALERVKHRIGLVLPSSMVARLDSWVVGLRKVREVGVEKIPQSLKNLHQKLHQLRQLVYRGEWHSVVPGTRTATREAEARILAAPTVIARGSAHGGWKQNIAFLSTKEPELQSVYIWKEGYAHLENSIDRATEKYSYIAAFSGTIKASKIEGGEYLLRVHTAEARSASGPWWVRLPRGTNHTNWREFLKDGKQWRTGLAVLDEFSVNGAFSIFRIKPGHTINTWEGRAAEQFGTNNPSQYLTGDMHQVYIEAWGDSFQAGVEWIQKGAATGWTDLKDVGYINVTVSTANIARVEHLRQDETQTKRRPSAGAH